LRSSASSRRIAIPNFIKFQARRSRARRRRTSRPSSRRRRPSFQEKDRFSVADGRSGLRAERNTVRVLLAATGTIEDRTNSVITRRRPYTGIQVDNVKYGSTSNQAYGATVLRQRRRCGCPADPEFVATAQGNIDADATVDQ